MDASSLGAPHCRGLTRGQESSRSPRSRISGRQSADSAATKVLNSAGDQSAGSTPISRIRRAMSSVAIAARIAAFSRAMIGRGVAAGTLMPCQP